MDINSGLDYEEWVDIYKCIIGWELKIDELDMSEMVDILVMQKSEVNVVFFKYLVKNYVFWMQYGDGFVFFNNLLCLRVFF